MPSWLPQIRKLDSRAVIATFYAAVQDHTINRHQRIHTGLGWDICECMGKEAGGETHRSAGPDPENLL